MVTKMAGKNRIAEANGHDAQGDRKKEKIEIAPLNIQRFKLKIVGTTPLIVHHFSDKSRKEMADKTEKKARGPKEARNPRQEYLDAFYLMPDSGPADTAKAKYGIPAAGFKGATKTACRFTDGVKMSYALGAFFILDDGGGLVQLKCSKPIMRTDLVRIGKFPNKIPTEAYRPEFKDWECTLTIEYNASCITASQIVNLFHYAGFHIGWGELRREKGFSYGAFRVEAV
jgi:hypothetical protein